mgnify:FL=1
MKEDQTFPIRNIVVLGANGGIGSHTVKMALELGHSVTAILRDPNKLGITHPNLTVVKGDIMKPDTFEKYMDNKDAVISAIGVKGGFGADKPTVLYSRGNANLLQIMKEKGISRAFFISASAIEISPLLPFYVRFLAKYIVQKLLRNMYADLSAMEKLIKETDVDWTILRPPRLTNGVATGHYRFAINVYLKNCLTISRADLAHFMIDNIANKGTYKSVIEIAY